MPKNKVADLKNSPLGPSSCEQFWNCPASVQLQQDIPNESSDYAQEGTNAHALAAYCLDKKIDPRSLIGEEMEDGDSVWEVTEDMAEAVGVYYDTVLKVIKEHGCQQLFVERKLSNPTIHELAFGTCDCYFLSKDGKLLFIFDYKHGRGVAVEALKNKQMMYYAALSADFAFVESVVLTIVQPRAKDSAESVKTWEVSIDEIMDFTMDLTKHMEATEEKNASANPGKWCRFCRAKFKCPAYTKNLGDLFPPESQQELLPDLPLEKYGEIYNKAIIFKDRFDAWFKQLESVLYRFAEAGTPAPGTKLVSGRKTRKWIDEKAAEEAFSEYGEQIYTPRKLKSPAQMEKIVDKEEVAELVEETSSLKLAPASDKRIEVNSIEQMFEVIDE